MDTHFHLDSLDKKILGYLTQNARISYLEIARNCRVSGAAIHQRIQKMTGAGIFSGIQFTLKTKNIGYLTCAFIGIQVNLTSTRTHEEVFEKIKQIPEIVECHHISGKYSLLVKIYTRNNEHLKNIIVEKIQSLPEITFTETFISLEEGFTRQISVDNL
ncbi:MAG: Lrp/AsnC ligand binding domain-containing protein [Lentimicrobiaceae bacterium]|nr:Lrp/AsnC ligand binding domain-containing protein [Lentimicrobiaceae bacterium]